MTAAILPSIDPKLILQRYLAEETGEQIAKSLGVTRAALSLHMLKHAEAEWKDAQVVKAIRRKEDAEDLLDKATTALELTRAREQLRSAQWDLERVCRRIYGQDTVPQGANAVQININLRGAQTAAHKSDNPVVDVQAVETNG
jgi:predicted transcriptional regulator